MSYGNEHASRLAYTLHSLLAPLMMQIFIEHLFYFYINFSICSDFRGSKLIVTVGGAGPVLQC